MISKELFIKTMSEIKKEREKINKFNKALYAVCDGHPVIELGNGYLDSLIEVLNVYFAGENWCDKYGEGWIDWWLFDSGEKKVWIQTETGQQEINVEDVGDFYDFLMKQKEEGNKSGD